MTIAIVVGAGATAIWLGLARLRARTTCDQWGHPWSLSLSPTRIYLRCPACGVETPGWQLFGAPEGCDRRRS